MLKDRNGNKIFFKDIKKINNKIEELKKLTKDNPTKEIQNKITSLLASETFSSLFVEGEISSRRNIRKSFISGSASKLIPGKEGEIIDDFIDAYSFALKKKEFNIANLFTLYTLVSGNGLNKEDKLEDGKMWRHEPVYIKSNKLLGDFEGFKHEEIQEALSNLFNYFTNSEDDLFLKAVLGHIYFEMIHPYFDFNGRTGRFIPMWLFANAGRSNEMMYFATAMGNYRKQYLSLFNKNIDQKTYNVNIDRLVGGIIDLLILNQKQYIWIKNIEKTYIDKTNKSFSPIQKDFIWLLMIKSEISKDATGWFRLTQDDKSFLESKLKSSLFSNETTKLRKAGIIKITSDKPRKYQLCNYQLKRND